MLQNNSSHISVSMGNKMFVISEILHQNCEVFDSISRKYNVIKPALFVKKYCFDNQQNAYCIGNKIVVFCSSYNCFVVHDTDKNEWSLKHFTPYVVL